MEARRMVERNVNWQYALETLLFSGLRAAGLHGNKGRRKLHDDGNWVRFRKAGKVYYLGSHRRVAQRGDQVVVETTQGMGLGEVISGAREVEDDQIVAP